MKNEFERKLAIKRAKADVRKALNDWYKNPIGIDEILKGMGYTERSYEYTKKVYTGMDSFIIRLDTYGLIIKNSKTIDIQVI